MTSRLFSVVFRRLLPGIIGLMVLTACAQTTAAPAQPTAEPVGSPTQASQPVVPTASQTPLPAATNPPAASPTAHALPTETPAATQTAAPSATAEQPLSLAANGLAGWCVSTEVLLVENTDPLTPLPGSRIGQITGSTFTIPNLPSNGCIFTYTFYQPAPAGLKLAVYEIDQPKPWLEADLTPVASHPNTVAVTLRHAYIAAPPLWKVSYDFVVFDSAGKEVRRDRVNLNRWQPPLCWNGQLPNINTLRCPLQQDLHPWDPSYGTPMPTAAPED